MFQNSSLAVNATCVSSVLINDVVYAWIGNQFLAQLIATPNTQWILHIDMTTFPGVYIWAEYSNFVLGENTTFYKLASVGTYKGNDCKFESILLS